MKTSFIFLSLLLVLIALTGCNNEAVSTAQGQQPQQPLWERMGFLDQETYSYFAANPGTFMPINEDGRHSFNNLFAHWRNVGYPFTERELLYYFWDTDMPELSEQWAELMFGDMYGFDIMELKMGVRNNVENFFRDVLPSMYAVEILGFPNDEVFLRSFFQGAFEFGAFELIFINMPSL